MSKPLPQETVNVLRTFNDISVEYYGYNCTLFILSNADTIDNLDIYATPEDKTYTEVATQVFLEWSPDTKRLRKLGIFTEDEIPILAWFKNTPKIPEIVRGSWFKIPLQYIPTQMDVDEFEIVDILVRGMGDKIALMGYKVVPRRVK